MSRDTNETAADANVSEAVETVQATDAENATTEATATDAAATPEAQSTEQPAATPTGPTKDQINAALEEFETLVLSIVGQPASDGEPEKLGTINDKNGEVPADDMAKIVEAYKNLLGGTPAQNKARERLTKNQMDALTTHMWAVGARAYALIDGALRSAKGARPKAEAVARPAVNPTEAHVSNAVAHVIAVNFLPVGEGVEANWGELVNAKATSLRDEIVSYNGYLAEKAKYDALSDDEKASATEPAAPEVDQIILAAARLARGRVASARKVTAPREVKPGSAAVTPRDPSAPRGDILKHIQEVFASRQVGDFLKVAEIAREASSQYGAGQASGGAIAARITSPKFAEVNGLAYVDEGHGKGVRKTA